VEKAFTPPKNKEVHPPTRNCTVILYTSCKPLTAFQLSALPRLYQADINLFAFKPVAWNLAFMTMCSHGMLVAGTLFFSLSFFVPKITQTLRMFNV